MKTLAIEIVSKTVGMVLGLLVGFAIIFSVACVSRLIG